LEKTNIEPLFAKVENNRFGACISVGLSGRPRSCWSAVCRYLVLWQAMWLSYDVIMPLNNVCRVSIPVSACTKSVTIDLKKCHEL